MNDAEKIAAIRELLSHYQTTCVAADGTEFESDCDTVWPSQILEILDAA